MSPKPLKPPLGPLDAQVFGKPRKDGQKKEAV